MKKVAQFWKGLIILHMEVLEIKGVLNWNENWTENFVWSSRQLGLAGKFLVQKCVIHNKVPPHS